MAQFIMVIKFLYIQFKHEVNIFSECSVIILTSYDPGILSSDPGDKILSGGHDTYPITTSCLTKNAAARNVFVSSAVWDKYTQ